MNDDHSVSNASAVHVEGHDPIGFASLDEVQWKLETIDVKAGIYRGYDAEGRLLKIETAGPKTVIRSAPMSHFPTVGHREEKVLLVGRLSQDVFSKYTRVVSGNFNGSLESNK